MTSQSAAWSFYWPLEGVSMANCIPLAGTPSIKTHVYFYIPVDHFFDIYQDTVCLTAIWLFCNQLHSTAMGWLLHSDVWWITHVCMRSYKSMVHKDFRNKNISEFHSVSAGFCPVFSQIFNFDRYSLQNQIYTLEFRAKRGLLFCWKKLQISDEDVSRWDLCAPAWLFDEYVSRWDLCTPAWLFAPA